MILTRVLLFIASSALVLAQTPVDRAWTILSEAAADKSHEKRGKAIHSLGLITANTRAIALAEAALADEREEVRATAADVLGVMRARRSVAKLKAAVNNDQATSVVFAAANALFVMGEPDAYSVYYAVLTGEKKSGDPLIESQMKMLKDPKALSKLGLEAGVGFIPFGGVSYKVLKMATSDDVSPVRAAAAMKLVGDPDPKAAAALSKSAADEKWLVRAAAVGALTRRNDPSALKVITPLLDDKEDVVRFNAASAVVQLSSSAAGKAKPAAKKN